MEDLLLTAAPAHRKVDPVVQGETGRDSRDYAGHVTHAAMSYLFANVNMSNSKERVYCAKYKLR